jgi:hypothetical protein
MTELALPSRQSSRRTALTALASAALAVGCTLAVLSLTARHGKSSGASAHVYAAPGHAFAIAYPAGWQAVPGAQLRGVQGTPALILRSPDRRSMLVVRQTATQANETLSRLAAQLTHDLKARFADFKPIGARLARTRGGAAFLYTFARTKAGVVQSIMVTRVRGRAYSLYAIAPAGDPAAARQLGQILGTFGGA